MVQTSILLRRILWAGIVVFIIICLAVTVVYFLFKPDPRRAAQEEAAVLSAYLSEHPGIGGPLGTLCGTPKEYVVSGRTESRSVALWTVLTWPDREWRAHWIPIQVLDNFVLRNLVSKTVAIAPVRRQMVAGVELSTSPGLKVIDVASSAKPDQVAVRFSRVGFDRELSRAMLYAEVSCAAGTNHDYVYLTNRYGGLNGAQEIGKWYILGIDRH